MLNIRNQQNIPIREKLAKSVCRGGLHASPGNKIVEADYGGIEVRVSACTHCDQNMIEYILDETTDMHRDCYSMDTKILTEGGFKYFYDIAPNEKIAQYNPEIDMIEFVVPVKSTCYTYTGDMYFINNKHIDLCVTPNHRLYFRTQQTSYQIKKASQINGCRYYHKTGGLVTIKEESTPVFSFPAVFGVGGNATKKYHPAFSIKGDDMFELLGYLITDGHFKKSKEGSYRINLKQSKQPHATIMKTCINRIKTYSSFVFHDESNRGMWSVSNKSFCTWLCVNFGVNKINRKLPKFITHAPLPQLRIFFDACILGDGSLHKKRGSGSMYAVSSTFVDDFQFICMRLGYSTSVTPLKLKGNRTVQVYRINIVFRNEFTIQWKKDVHIKKYDGEVFCFTVDSGLLVVQRNNKISVQGNSAADLFCLTPERVPKQLRQSAKSNWVFPQFYGSWFQECGKNLWEECVEGGFELNNGVPLKQHLKDNKIRNQEAFLKHCQKSEDIFWNERFKGYKQWKFDINKQYRKTGVITNPFGFEFKGYMKENDVTNYPIQSAAFHCLLWSLIRINRYLQYKDMKTKIIGQVHDSIVFDLYPPEQVEVLSVVNYIGTTLLRETFPWIIVPMIIEFEITDVDKPWNTKTDIELNEHHNIFTEENLIGQIEPDVMEDIDIWK